MTDAYLPPTLQILMSSRRDLRRLNYQEPANERTLARWLINYGIREYPDLLWGTHLSNDALRWLASPSREVPGLSRVDLAIWDSTRSHKRVWPLPKTAGLFRNWLRLFWPGETMGLPKRAAFFGGAANGAAIDIADRPRGSHDRERPFGINLIGYATYALGIGEDARTTYRALREADIPTALIDFNPGDIEGRRDYSLADDVAAEAPYSISLLCMTAEETARYWLSGGMRLLDQTYAIGYWPWELSNWPALWQPINNLVDEVWVSSSHIANAIKPSLTKSLSVMPLCVDEPDAALSPVSDDRRLAIREQFGLSSEAVLYIFSFDLNSYIHRKNPWGCLEAFQSAFDQSEGRDDVGLIIKCFPPSKPNETWTKLKRAAEEDPRVTIIESNLDRRELLDLYGCCDAYLSLHRAEGFGRCLAEAFQLGLDVIATDWSGNVDFCQGPLARKVGYELVSVPKGHYIHWRDQQWAEPDMTDAVNQIRAVRDDRANADRSKLSALAKTYKDEFSVETCAANYSKRLKAIENALSARVS